MDEEMKKKIRDSADELELPESLCPEQIEALLSEKTVKKPVPIFRFAAAAAAVLVLVLAPAVYLRTQPEEQGEESLSLMAAPVEEGTGAATGLNTYAVTGQQEVKTAKNMEEIQARVQLQSAGTQSEKRAAGLMLSNQEAPGGGNSEEHEDYGSAGLIGLYGDVLWFYQDGYGLAAAKTEEGRLEQFAEIPDKEDGSVAAFYAAGNSLFVARQNGGELLTQIYGRKAGEEQWEEVWRAVSEGELETIGYDGTSFYVTMRCYPKAGEEERAFLPVAGGRQLNYEEIYLPDQAGDKNQYMAAFSVDSEDPDKGVAAAAVFGNGQSVELVFSEGSIRARPLALKEISSEKDRFTAGAGTQPDGQPALQVTLTAQGMDEAAALTIPEFTPGIGSIVSYGNEYAVIPAVSSEGENVRLVVSWDEITGLALERVMETEGEVRAVLCSGRFLYLLTDEKLLCYNRSACGIAGSLDLAR